MLLEMEAELLELCEKFTNILYDLKEKSLISEDEFNIHSKEKIKFIERSTRLLVLQ